MKRALKFAVAAGAAAGAYALFRSRMTREAPQVVGTVPGAAILRTPAERFADLPGYPFTPNYLQIDDLRLHYVDEGPRDGQVVLMLHGEPTWSYLYRKMIPLFVAAGHRAIAPDLIGFGKSDKPGDVAYYTYERHVAWVRQFIKALDLQQITLICQDWGSLIGLRLAGEHPERFARIVAANAMLPTGDRPPNQAFQAWLAFSQRMPILPIGRIVQMGATGPLPPEVRAAYEAPFPGEAYKAGARAFPALVPITPDDPASAANRQAWAGLGRFERPFLTVFGEKDPILGRGDRILQQHIPGAAGQPHRRLAEAGHFIQEDSGPELAQITLEFMDANPLATG